MPTTTTTVGSPQTFTPAYNPSVWYFDSSNKSQPGFRYLVEIYSAANALLGTYRFTPRMGDGYAVVDLTRILKNFVTFNLFAAGVNRINQSWFGYYLKVYEEYSIPYIYDDYVFASGDWTNLTSNVTLDTHTFNVGDQVQVAQADGGVTKPMLQGLFTVISPTVPGTSDLFIDIHFSDVGSGPAIGGQVIYADNRKTISAVQITTATSYVFNGAIPWADFPDYLQGDYTMTAASTTKKFLTSMPRTGFSVYPSQDVRLNFANYFTENKTVRFGNSNGDVFSITSIALQSPFPILGAGVGPSTVPTTVIFGSLPLIKPTTEYYDVWVVDGSGVRVSEKIRFNIDRRCRIEDYEILFLDRMGSFNSFALELRSKTIINNSKSDFKKLAGDLDAGAYSYALTDRGAKVYNVDLTQTIELNTNWMDDASSLYFQELITSPETYLKVGSDYRSIVVMNNTSEVLRQKNKRLIKYTIGIKMANNDNVNI